MKREYHVGIDRDAAGYYVASVPALPGCHTQARSLDTLMKRIQEAIDLCVEVRGHPGSTTEFVGGQKIAAG